MDCYGLCLYAHVTNGWGSCPSGSPTQSRKSSNSSSLCRTWAFTVLENLSKSRDFCKFYHFRTVGHLGTGLDNEIEPRSYSKSHAVFEEAVALPGPLRATARRNRGMMRFAHFAFCLLSVVDFPPPPALARGWRKVVESSCHPPFRTGVAERIGPKIKFRIYVP